MKLACSRSLLLVAPRLKMLQTESGRSSVSSGQWYNGVRACLWEKQVWDCQGLYGKQAGVWVIIGPRGCCANSPVDIAFDVSLAPWHPLCFWSGDAISTCPAVEELRLGGISAATQPKSPWSLTATSVCERREFLKAMKLWACTVGGRGRLKAQRLVAVAGGSSKSFSFRPRGSHQREKPQGRCGSDGWGLAALGWGVKGGKAEKWDLLGNCVAPQDLPWAQTGVCPEGEVKRTQLWSPVPWESEFLKKC